ncbi:MAG: hypothetical protein ACK521_04310 [bacterium]
MAFTMNQIASNPYLYFLYVFLVNACEGGHVAIFPPLATKIYGIK